ncbi:LCP family protein [Salinicoccus albus]|uniref:LCP family protein n=1 Tax=Salinicoccus albus TaxID=418756 RepID=UPI00037DFBCC|nr:LCP family protein [Salinicoccus albus]
MNNEYRRGGRPEHKKTVTRKKLRKRAFIPLILIVLLIGAGLYIYFSFQSGLNIAEENGAEQGAYEFNGADNNDGKKNMLLLGTDKEEDGGQRTDVIMIAQYDYMTKDMKMMSIMRDTFVEVPGYQPQKINSVYSLGGADLLRETLQLNFGIDIEEYAVVDYQAFESVANVINGNGIPIDVEKDMSAKIDTEIEAGEQQLNGEELLAYARFRHDDEGDFGRVRRQQQVISALQDEVLSVGGLFRLPKIAGTGIGHVNTSLSNGEMYRMMASFLVRGDKDIQSMTVPRDHTWQFVDTPNNGSVIDLDFEANSEAMHDFLEGDGNEEQ